MSKKQEVLSAVLSQNVPFYSTTIASLSGASPALISNTINELIDAGKLTTHKDGKKNVYTLTGSVNNTLTTITTEPICTVAERFDYIHNLVDMVIKGVQPSVLITGQSGIGKSYIVKSRLKMAGLNPNEDYIQVSGHSSPFGLFKLLHDHRDEILVMDDVDSIFHQPSSVNVLKAALDSYATRYVSWCSDKADQQELESPFEFTGRIIFISNLFAERIDPAVRSRSFCFDLRMSNDEISEHMQNILKDLETTVDMILKQEVLDFVKSIQNRFMNYNIRVLIQAIRIRKYCLGTDKDWKKMIEILAQETSHE